MVVRSQFGQQASNVVRDFTELKSHIHVLKTREFFSMAWWDDDKQIHSIDKERGDSFRLEDVRELVAEFVGWCLSSGKIAPQEAATLGIHLIRWFRDTVTPGMEDTFDATPAEGEHQLVKENSTGGEDSFSCFCGFETVFLKKLKGHIEQYRIHPKNVQLSRGHYRVEDHSAFVCVCGFKTKDRTALAVHIALAGV